MASETEIADGIDKLIAVFKPDDVWGPPRFTLVTSDKMCIADALFMIFPGPYVPLRGAIGDYLARYTSTAATYFWENRDGRTQDDVRALLNQAFEEIMK